MANDLRQLGRFCVRALGAASRRTPSFAGKTRLVRALDRALRWADPLARPIATTIDGLRFELDPRDHIQHALFYHGAYEPDVGGWLVREIQARGARTLWDVGANIGALSLPLLARFPALAVEAFEAMPEIAKQYATHMAANMASLSLRARLHVLALSDCDGEAPFYPSASLENAGLGSLMASASSPPEPIRVGTRRGDTLVARGLARPPDVLKIDVEGFEHEVVRGLGDLLRRARPSIIFEHSPLRLVRRGLALDAVVRDLEGHGYVCSRLAGDVEVALTRPDLRERIEIIARPSGI